MAYGPVLAVGRSTQAPLRVPVIAVGLVLGPYQILAPVGKGGMGTVFLARDERNGQLVALKVLPPRRAREEERTLARFRREMLPAFESGRLSVTIDSVFAPERAAEAFQRMRQNRNVGKIVIEWAR